MAEVKRFTLNEMARRNEASGQHWFDESSRKFFGTRILGNPDEHNRFVTSEAPPFKDYSLGKRAYSIREFDTETNGVRTVGEFRGYATADSARRAMGRLGE